MDPAEEETLHHAISMQGNLVGQHDKTLKDLDESINSIGTIVTQLHARLNQAPKSKPHGPSDTAAAGPSVEGQPSSPASPVLPTHDAHIPTPERYSGELGSCGCFLLQCSLVFDNQPNMYTSDAVKIAFVVSLLSSHPCGPCGNKTQTSVCPSLS